MILFDLKSYAIDGIMRYQINGSPSSSTIEALAYDMLSVLNSKKSSK
jgi:hypothetical protein